MVGVVTVLGIISKPFMHMAPCIGATEHYRRHVFSLQHPKEGSDRGCSADDPSAAPYRLRLRESFVALYQGLHAQYPDTVRSMKESRNFIEVRSGNFRGVIPYSRTLNRKALAQGDKPWARASFRSASDFGAGYVGE
jgi:hypothetical protein